MKYLHAIQRDHKQNGLKGLMDIWKRKVHDGIMVYVPNKEEMDIFLLWPNQERKGCQKGKLKMIAKLFSLSAWKRANLGT